jgi:hypothetical protein
LANNRGAVQPGPPPENTSADNAANLIAGRPRFGRHTGKPQLFSFGSFVLVRPFFGSIYRREKRVAARRGVYVA